MNIIEKILVAIVLSFALLAALGAYKMNSHLRYTRADDNSVKVVDLGMQNVGPALGRLEENIAPTSRCYT